MAAGTGGLGGLALGLRGAFPIEEGVRAQDLGIGAAAAAALYGVFALGRAIAGRLLPSAPGQISDVYALRAQAPWPVIALLLILVIGPGEELFWRGLVQWGLVRRFGPGLGWGAATAIYGGGVLGSHREVIADGEDRGVETALRDQRHVREERGIPGVVETPALDLQQDARGVPAVG